MKNYKVITIAENTGLDLAVFASKEEAMNAIELAKPLFDASFDAIPTSEPANTTYSEWASVAW